jgi:cytochrome d ubiquinol oxidase subunit II
MSFAIGLPEIVAGLMMLALNAYALTGGADFGGGVWDMLARGPRREAQRAHIASSLAPIWEANHVWLIVVVVMLFTGFPRAFGILGIVLHIPLSIMLFGVVLRGAAFVFRSYGSATDAQRHRWGVTFAVASIVTPVTLGMIVGAIASGAVGAVPANGPFVASYVRPWLGMFPFVVGLFALALFAFLAAVYLAHGARDTELREDFRRKAMGSAVLVFLLAAIALAVGALEAPRIAGGVARSAWAIPLQLMTGVAAIIAVIALRRRDYRVARMAAGAQVSLILWGWVLAQYPYVIPISLTIRDAAAPRETLILLVIGLGVGTAILVPSLRYLYKLFARPADFT